MPSLRNTLRGLVLSVLSWASLFVHAADIYPFSYDSGALSYVVIEGRIEQGDFDKFIRLVKDGQGRVQGVVLFSPGGDFEEAIKIGRALRSLDLGSMVPSRDNRGAPQCTTFMNMTPTPKDPKNCIAASAAFFIHVGAVTRSGLHLVVHRPYYSSKAFGQLSEPAAKKAFDSLQEKSRLYMDEMGVPKRVQEDVLGTASDQGLVLDDTTVRTHFLGDLPYYHEWMRNKCATLDDDEEQRNAQYVQRFLKNRDMSKAALTPDESRDYTALQAKEKQARNCQVAVGKERRLAAYEKYFGAKPNDSAGYAFNAWPDQVKFLGRRLDDIMNEERVTEEKFMGGRTLTRKASGSYPYMLIYDSKSNPGIAAEISILSFPNPSKDFNDKLAQSISGAWGKPTFDTGTEKTWNSTNFQATLNTDMKSGDGTSTVLHMLAK